MLASDAMLNHFRRVLFGVAAGSLLAASPALADWEADLHLKPMTSRAGEAVKEMKGRAYGRNNMMRMDMETENGPMSTLVDRDKRTVFAMMHSQKMAMQMDTSHLEVDLPGCGKKDFKACLVQQGYKKTGSEKVNGHPTDLYEKDEKLKSGTVHIKAWVPTDIKEALVVRSQSTDASGATSEMNLTNVKVKAQPDTRFTVPSDYRIIQRPGAAGAPPQEGKK